MGPIAKTRNIKGELVWSFKILKNWILIIVKEKPIQFTIVSAVPFSSWGADFATKVENKGESAITAIPQKSKKVRNRKVLACKKNNGELKQQTPENDSAIDATFLSPYFWDKNPPKTQDKLPIAIIKKDNNEIFKYEIEW